MRPGPRSLPGTWIPTWTSSSASDDGSEFHAPLGIRLSQAIHHGTDHRSQVCTALTNLGITPPEIDVWDYAQAGGRLVDVPATSG